MKTIIVFLDVDATLRIRVCIRHPVRFGHLFLGKSGVNSTGLCLRENQQ